jgi:hypothetical protein
MNAFSIKARVNALTGVCLLAALAVTHKVRELLDAPPA